MIKFELPKDVQFILNRLHDAGEEAYVVGGCVRDMLLECEPYDWDITTSATPEYVKSLFNKTIDTGISHGTVTVLVNNEGYEVTTYRVDGIYEDYRRPKEVMFTRSLSEDLLRRDFTINAMAYNENEGIIDLYEGVNDLEHKIIRCVGEASERFNEDALRMLRAVRFSAKLGFKIEEKTYTAIKTYAHLIQHVSAERIQVEMTKILISDYPEKIKELSICGLIDFIIPDFKAVIGLVQNNPYHKFTVDDHIYNSLRFVPNLVHLRWTMYLHDTGKGFTRTTDENGIHHFYGHQKVSEEIAKKALKSLKFDNKTYNQVTKLIRFHDDRFNTTKKAVRKAVSRIGIDYFDDLLLIKEADIKSQHHSFEVGNLAKLKEIRLLYEEILEDDECLSVKDLSINGNDLLELGVLEGKDIGRTLKMLLERVLEQPELNNRETLLKIVKETRL